ncbi:MAG: sulfatase [Acidobacteria bacterium]|nr:sulfatase [Acidobacteriota bacterium]
MNIRRRTLLGAVFGAAPLPAAPKTPNIIFVLADDLGWAELGCHGNRFNETPNLDRMAREGLRFTHCYSAAPVCSPMRASFMTGQYPARVGITDFLRGDDANHLSPKLPTLPKMLAQAGYATCLIGKWHLMGDYKMRPGDPFKHGFQKVVCSETKYIGPGDYFYPYGHMPEVAARRHGEYLTDRLYDEAVDFIRESAAKPFFLYLAHYAPHTRLAGKPELVKKYQARPDAGRNRNNPQLAAMLESIDEGMGRILATLEELRLSRDTLLIFTSDNGGEHNVTTNGTLRGAKSQLYEGGIREPFLARWPGHVPAAATCDAPICSVDYYPTFLELAGVRRPAGHVVDGMSVAGLLRKPAQKQKPRILFWHYPLDKPHFLGGRSASAVRDGDWKLIEFFDTPGVELYNLAADPGESRDLAAAELGKVKELRKKLGDWRAATVKR